MTPTPPDSRSPRTPHDTPALVVGAGPVGLAAALALRALEVPVTVLEARSRDAQRPGSRALYVHRSSLRLLEQASPGLSRDIAGYGVTWHTRRTLYRGREVYARSYPPASGDGLPPFTSLRQVETERFLRKAAELAGAHIAWDAEVRDVETSPDGVRVTAADGREWSAQYVVAADGARSAVRRAVGIDLGGSRAEGFHLVVDIADGPEPRPAERVLHYAHPRAGGRHVLTVPFAGGFQIDLQCKEDDPVDKLTDPDLLKRWLPKVVDPEAIGELLWISQYRFLQVLADRFADETGRVLLAGEAAHLFPPFGARGMNSGITDADAAAQAIALALMAGRTPRARAAVAAYARDRRAAAVDNSAAVGAALAHLRPIGWLARTRLTAAGRLAPWVPRLGEWLERAPYGPRTTSRRKPGPGY
ncbi:FAD-dependent monooxygenase [Streptomyces sp. NPDC020883]|uniref:FAD-dependent monooxygenase n=1 Tax=Streptomyces sp. NPDC020883 TaxID=3365099 RepID=UPI0037B75328